VVALVIDVNEEARPAIIAAPDDVLCEVWRVDARHAWHGANTFEQGWPSLHLARPRSQ
jgi:hypothetical protein